MNEEELQRELIAASGEAIFAGLNVSALWTALITQGLLHPEVAVATINGVLLGIEVGEAQAPFDTEVLEHVKARGKSLAEFCSRMQPAQKPGDST